MRVVRHDRFGPPEVLRWEEIPDLEVEEPGAKRLWAGILVHGVSAAGKEAFSRLLAAELAPATSASSTSIHTLSSMRRRRVLVQ